MKISQKLISRWLHYLMDVTCFLLLTVWVFAPFYENQYVKVLILSVLGAALLEVFFRISLPTYGKVLLFIPILIGIGWLMDLDMMVTIFTSAIVGWRFTKHYFDGDVGEEIGILLLSYTSGILFYFLYSSNDDVPFVISLVMIQTLLFAMIRVNRYVQQNPNKAVNGWIRKFSFGILATTFIIAVAFPYIKSAVFFLMKGIAAVLALILYYPLSWIFSLFESLVGPMANDEPAEDPETSLEENEEMLKQMNDITNQNEWLSYMLFTLLIAALIWYGIKLYRRKLGRANSFAFDGTGEKSAVIQDNFQDQQLGRKTKAPKDSIRRQLYQLEKKMAGYELGRQSHESVLEWLGRIDSPQPLTLDINRIYQRVRYGEQHVEDTEEAAYKNSIAEMTEWGKETYKQNKKEQKRKDRLDK